MVYMQYILFHRAGKDKGEKKHCFKAQQSLQYVCPIECDLQVGYGWAGLVIPKSCLENQICVVSQSQCRYFQRTPF